MCKACRHLLAPVLPVLLAPLHLQRGVLQRRYERVCAAAGTGSALQPSQRRPACRGALCEERTFDGAGGDDARVHIVRQSQEPERGNQQDRKQQLQPPGKAAYPGRRARIRDR